jgi:hypothetical protein
VLSTLRIGCVLVFLLFTGLALAQDFSADINATGNANFKKVYATADKVRIEGSLQQPGVGAIAWILDESKYKWFVLLEQRHVYLDSLPEAITGPVITQFWRVQDADDACPQWKKVAEQQGTASHWGSCTRVGDDTVNGRSTVKYEGADKEGKKSHYWVDRKLRCVIKTDQGNGDGIELRNIQEGSQPGSLFEIPAGYMKVDIATLMRSQ